MNSPASALDDDPFALGAIVPRSDDPMLPADIERYVEAARLEELARKGAGAAATLRAYRADWRVFTAWCAGRGFSPVPALPVTVAKYIRFLIDRPREIVAETYAHPSGKIVTRNRRVGPAATSTVHRHIVSIRMAHKLRGFDDPTADRTFKNVARGIKIERGVKARFQKSEIRKTQLLDALAAIGAESERLALIAVDAISDDRLREAERSRFEKGELALTGVVRKLQLQRARDHAVLLLGWSGAFRRAEIAAISCEHVREEPQGLHIEILRSKRNQEGADEFVLIHRAADPANCPVRAVAVWRALAEVSDGPLFRRIDRHGRILGGIQGAVVNAIVKKSIEASGESPESVGAHSLRSGWISTGIAEGRREEAMMRHSRHLSIAVFRGYVRRAGKWDDHAAAGLL